MPNQAGTYFGDTIIYICEHSKNGAMGLLVNRPSRLTLVELLSQVGLSAPDVSIEIPVMEGGPVASGRGFVLHTEDQSFESSLGLGKGLMLSSAREILEAIASGDGPKDFLVTMGYAGWASGQLEDELKGNAWLNFPANLDVLFRTPFDDRANQAAATHGIDFRLISGQAGHA